MGTYGIGSSNDTPDPMCAPADIPIVDIVIAKDTDDIAFLPAPFVFQALAELEHGGFDVGVGVGLFC